MTGEPDDEALLDEMRWSLRPDPAPEGMLARAEALLDRFGDPADAAPALAELRTPESELVGARGTAEAERLVFRVADDTIHVEADTGPGQLTGQILAGEIELIRLERQDSVERTMAPDALGRFAFTGVPSGPVRLQLLLGQGPPVMTDWFLL
jgi:hypothetical protein